MGINSCEPLLTTLTWSCAISLLILFMWIHHGTITGPFCCEDIMAASTRFFTYRFSNLPNNLQRSDIQGFFSPDDANRIDKVSLAPSIHLPSTFNVTSITFNGEPTFRRRLANGEGEFPNPNIPGYERIKVDDTFYGLTPLNTPSGNLEAEHHISCHFCTF